MYGRNVRIGGPITPWVKNLLIINGVIFFVQLIAKSFGTELSLLFGLSHNGLVGDGMIWQIFTYMFLHGGVWHLFFNMLMIWMFAGELEQLWGSPLFIRYYLYSGVGAGLFIAFLNFISYRYLGVSGMATTIGASGAIYALFLAYGITWPNREVLFMFIFPIKIKYLLLGLGLFEFFSTIDSISSPGGGISHIGHLGGLISGYIFIYVNSKRTSIGVNKVSGGGNFLTNALKKVRLKKKQKKIDDRIKAKKIIDELLEKIARTGMSSLTSEEKRRLEWARKNYHPSGNDTMH